MQVLKARIETNLMRNNPKKYRELEADGKLGQWLQMAADQASEAMNSTSDDANLSQRAELAAEHLNPPVEDEESPDIEESPEDAWLSNREEKIMLEDRKFGRGD